MYVIRFQARGRSALVRPSAVLYDPRKLCRMRSLQATISKSLPVECPPRLTRSSLGTVWHPKQLAATS